MHSPHKVLLDPILERNIPMTDDTNQTGPVVVTGATGKQGGAVARALLSQGQTVHALVRTLDAPAALALQQAGAVLVPGDLDDEASLRQAFAGAYGVFSIQNPDFADLEADTEGVRGKNVIRAAQASGIQHFVQTSATGAGDYFRLDTEWLAQGGAMNSLIQKGEIEDAVKEAGFAHWTILRPAFFMENLPYILQDGQLISAYAPTKPIPLVAVANIGAAVATIFAQPERFDTEVIEFASDFLTMPHVAAVLSAAWGADITAPPMSAQDVLATGMMAPMVKGQEWHNFRGMPARPEVAHHWGFELTSLHQWAIAHSHLLSA